MDMSLEGYDLSKNTIEKLKKCENIWKKNSDTVENISWKRLFPFEENKGSLDDSSSIVIDDDDNEMEIDDAVSQKDVSIREQLSDEAETFFYTQSVVNPHSQNKKIANLSNEQDQSNLAAIISRIVESLEHKNGFLDCSHVKNLSDADVTLIIKKLSKELSLTGVDNLCKSVCDMNEIQATYWIKVVCSNLLLQKIINLENSSGDRRTYSKIIGRIFTKYPEDGQNLIFTPMLNSDLKNTSVIESIIKSSSSQQKKSFLLDFATNVNELKAWHISSLLPLLADVKIEGECKNSLLRLLVNKASEFSKDRIYSKFVLKFIKLNSPYTEEEKSLLQEIVVFNDTLFSSSIEDTVDNLYISSDEKNE